MIVTAGSTNVTVYFYVTADAGTADPAQPHTGMAFGDLTSASYVRQGAARVAITPATLASASAAHSDGGFIEVDATNTPGLYRFDIPDAAVVTGVDQVIVYIQPAAGQEALVSPLNVDITDVDLRDAVRGGMTALPAADADAAGGLPISDAGGLDMDALPRAGGLLESTTIATLASQTSFTLTAGSADDDAYNRCTFVIRDQTTGVQKTVAYADDYAGSTRTVTLDATHTPRFTIAVGDFVDIYAQMTHTPGFFHEITVTPTGELQVDSFTSTARALIELEVEDALQAMNLDHLVAVGSAPAVVSGTYLDLLQGATFATGTDSLEAIRNHIGDGTNLTEAGGTGDHLTALPISPANVTQINSDADAAAQLASSTVTIQTFTVDAGTFTPTTTQVEVDAVTPGSLESTDDHYIGRTIVGLTGALAYQGTDITDYDGTNNRFTFTAMTEAFGDNDTFIVV